MRIISGEFKGRKLATIAKSSQGSAKHGMRPTSGRVREAIFSMLHSSIEGSICLDLFAGTGALGIEALSRGASRVYFCDIFPDSLDVLKQNLDTCRIDGRRAVIIREDWRSAATKVSEKCNLVFIDAPYDMCDYYSQILEILADQSVVADGAAIIVERDSRAGGYVLPSGFEMIREKRYGGTGVDLLVYAESGGGNERG